MRNKREAPEAAKNHKILNSFVVAVFVVIRQLIPFRLFGSFHAEANDLPTQRINHSFIGP